VVQVSGVIIDNIVVGITNIIDIITAKTINKVISATFSTFIKVLFLLLIGSIPLFPAYIL
jgi:hypothetical protein